MFIFIFMLYSQPRFDWAEESLPFFFFLLPFVLERLERGREEEGQRL